MILLGYAETTIMFPFRLCGDMLPVEVIRERRYGPNRLRVNDDDESRHSRPSAFTTQQNRHTPSFSVY